MEVQLAGVAHKNAAEIAALDLLANHRLRRGIAVFAAICPVIIILLGLALGPWRGSLSEYYYSAYHCKLSVPADANNCHFLGNFLRDFFVGGLCAMGSLLALYRGYSRREDWALSLAGISVACMALSPMHMSPDGLPISGWPNSLNGRIHLTGLTCFVLFIAYVAVVCSETTLSALKDPARQQRYRLIYRLIGAEMVCMPVIVIAFSLLSESSSHYIILALEIICIWTFAGFWLLKSSEIAAIEAQLKDSASELKPLHMGLQKIA